jgi:hypothetical protein
MFTKFWKPEGKRLVEKNRHSCEDNIKGYLKETDCDYVYCNNVTGSRVEFSVCFLNSVLNYAVSC